MVQNPIKMDDLGGPPLFLETPRWADTLLYSTYPVTCSNRCRYHWVVTSLPDNVLPKAGGGAFMKDRCLTLCNMQSGGR